MELIEVSKRYPGVIANERVSLKVRPGEIRAIVGENGAGKSTLMKVIYGSVRPDEGQIIWDGREIDFLGPQQMRELGVGMVFQHFSLFESLTVLENIILSMPDSATEAHTRVLASSVAAKYGLQLSLDSKVEGLSVGERQQVEIARCLLSKPRLLIFDEPTAVLPAPAIEALFKAIRKLAQEGCAILYISHKLAEIKALCDYASVLRNGQMVGEVKVSETPEADLAVLMTGRELPIYERYAKALGDVMLHVQSLSSTAASLEEVELVDVSFEVRTGEVLGLAGVSGSGQRELFELLSGERLSERNAVSIGERPVGRADVKERRALGVAYIPEERVGQGALPDLSLEMNFLLSQGGAPSDDFSSFGLLRSARLSLATKATIEEFKVKTSGATAAAATLSGGNLQKFIVGRELGKRPKVLLVAQPTWGVDIASSMFIRQQIVELAREGAAVLVGSEDVDELMQMCDRIMVIAKGKVSPAIPRQEMSAQRLGLWMAGLFDEPTISLAKAS
ncbi:ABC transporter ATP-binding protein [Cupriavidus necator]